MLWWPFVMMLASSAFCQAFKRSHLHSIAYSRPLSNHGFFHEPIPKDGAYDAARLSHPTLPCIILVQPFLEQNIGSIARTMLNFGLSELRLVDPQCNHRSDLVKGVAMGAFDIIQHAKVFSNMSESISDLQRVMATSTRYRRQTQMLLTPRKAALEAVTSTGKVGVVFGCERNGLSNEDIGLADTLISIPTFSKFTSLNLAQAVNIMAYELWTQHSEHTSNSRPEEWLHAKEAHKLATKGELEVFFTRLTSTLDKNKFVSTSKELTHQRIRNIFQRTLMTTPEVDLMHGVLTSLTVHRKKFGEKDKEDGGTGGCKAE